MEGIESLCENFKRIPGFGIVPFRGKNGGCMHELHAC
jgi:hypothetical protein